MCSWCKQRLVLSFTCDILPMATSLATYILVNAILIHISLAGVIFKRESWPKEDKPQVWSGPNLCYDKGGNNKFPLPKDPPWFTDDMCHLSVCLGLMVLTKSMCFTKGSSCGELNHFHEKQRMENLEVVSALSRRLAKSRRSH